MDIEQGKLKSFISEIISDLEKIQTDNLTLLDKSKLWLSIGRLEGVKNILDWN